MTQTAQNPLVILILVEKRKQRARTCIRAGLGGVLARISEAYRILRLLDFL